MTSPGNGPGPTSARSPDQQIAELLQADPSADLGQVADQQIADRPISDLADQQLAELLQADPSADLGQVADQQFSGGHTLCYVGHADKSVTETSAN